MPPDINSLSPSPYESPRMSSTTEGQAHRASPTLSPQTTSLAAAAALNAGLQNEEQNIRRTSSGAFRGAASRDRRRSSIRMNLSLNDPSLPAPGEMLDTSPVRHTRQPSIGELHQELESEQEAQVNRLLLMIRQQQAQIQQLQPDTSATESPVEQSPAIDSHRSTFQSRHSSQSSPSLRPFLNPHLPAPLPLGASSSGDEASHSPASSFRDHSAFYQAETQNLTRENQMLKLRIRELERQLGDTSTPALSTSSSHSPAQHSTLHTSSS
jgi:hypothetical protein